MNEVVRREASPLICQIPDMFDSNTQHKIMLTLKNSQVLEANNNELFIYNKRINHFFMMDYIRPKCRLFLSDIHPGKYIERL